MPSKGEEKFEKIVDDIKKKQSEEKDTQVETAYAKIVIFTLNKDYYAFPGTNIKDLIQYEEITFVPGCPDFISGIINVRGDIESVINVHKLMGLKESGYSNKTRIAIAVGDDIRSGILVDSVEDVIDVPIDAIHPPISTLDRTMKDFVTGKLDYNGHVVTLLNVNKIFGKIAE
jgi:purine-binding chemotaxis protein CheW